MVRARITPNYLDIAEVLLTPPLPKGELHGYAIRTAIRGPISLPVVYAALRDLARGGWLDGRWSDDDEPGARRHVYTLTDTGRAGLVDLLDRHRPRKLHVLRALLAATYPGVTALDIVHSGKVDVAGTYDMLTQLERTDRWVAHDGGPVVAARPYRLTAAGRERATTLIGATA